MQAALIPFYQNTDVIDDLTRLGKSWVNAKIDLDRQICVPNIDCNLDVGA